MSALKIHIRSHTNEKNYVCLQCTKAFTNASDLRKHVKIHSTFKEFRCALCELEFTQRIHAKRHVSKYHPEALIEESVLKQTINDMNFKI